MLTGVQQERVNPLPAIQVFAFGFLGSSRIEDLAQQALARVARTLASSGVCLGTKMTMLPAGDTRGNIQVTLNDGPGVVYAWKELDETDEQVLERIYQERPEAQRARQVIVCSWQSPT